jgi:hypothetical protein
MELTMGREDNFEKKIKDKLEEVYTPYENSAWENFAPLLPAQKIPFWKLWYMPYVYSSLLFVLATFLYLQKEHKMRDLGGFEERANGQTIDTLLLKDTVFIVDTVYVYRTVVIEQTTTTQSKKPYQELVSSINIDPLRAYDKIEKSEFLGEAHQSFGDSKDKSTDDGIAADEEIKSTNKENTPINRSDSLILSNGTTITPSSPSNAKTLMGTAQGNTIMAPSLKPEETFVMKLDKELVEGDTSNLTGIPLKEKTKPFFNLEAGLSLLIPISENIDFYSSSAQSINFGLEWENGFGLYTGIIRNNLRGEIDDDDIAAFKPSTIESLPGKPTDINTIDEIYITNRQWYFPLEFRWRSLYYSGFSFESSFGVMGNYLVRQDLRYEFDNSLNLEDQFGSVDSDQFKISHLKIGVGTNYLMSGRWGLFLRSHYWLPISGTGLLEYKMNGLEVGLGMNYFLGRKIK